MVRGDTTRCSLSVEMLRACDRVSKKHFGRYNVTRDAGLLIVAVESPDELGRLRACGDRTKCQERLGFFIEIYDPSMGAAPLCNHGGLRIILSFCSPYFRLS
jgi:hypothetical protein